MVRLEVLTARLWSLASCARSVLNIWAADQSRVPEAQAMAVALARANAMAARGAWVHMAVEKVCSGTTLRGYGNGYG